MTWSLTSPITGGAQTGFTTPTYTFQADTAPDTNGKQVAVTTLGGTQAGVTGHTGSSPFTITFVKPKVFKTLGQPNPVTGLVSSVPKNQYKLILRKGVTPLAGQPFSTMNITVTMDVPAGAETEDPANVRAAVSAAIGALTQQSAGVGDTLTSNLF